MSKWVDIAGLTTIIICLMAVVFVIVELISSSLDRDENQPEAQIVVKCDNSLEYYTKINDGDDLRIDCSDYYYESIFDFPLVRTYRTKFINLNKNQ